MSSFISLQRPVSGYGHFYSVKSFLFIALLLLLIGKPQLSYAIKCNATNTGVSNSGELYVNGTPCTGGINLSMSGAVCANSGCTLEYMFVIYQAGGSSFSSAWSSLPYATLSVPSSGYWNVIGCVREVGKPYPCETSITTISVVGGPTGTPTNLQATAACQGENFTLSGTVSGGNTINWYDNANHLIGTGLSIPHSESAAGTYTYKAHLFNGTCNASTYASINVTVGAKPSPVNISGPSSVVSGTQYTFTTPNISGASFSWSYTATGTGSSSTNSISINWSTTGSKVVEVVVNLNGCVASDQFPVNVFNNLCFPSTTNYGQYSLNHNMNGQTVVDGAGTAITYNVSDPNAALTSFHLNQNFSRSGDTSIYYAQSAGQTTTARIRSNTKIADLKFCVRDIDHNTNASNFVKDRVTVNAYQGASIFTITSSVFTKGSAVVFDGSNMFHGEGDVAGNSENGDVCFDFSGYQIDSVRLIFNNENFNGAISQDMGISNLTWCTTTPVPVTLLGFSASETGNQVMLEWSTASEINNEGFMVQSSEDGIEFNDIGKVAGAGNSQRVVHYQFADPTPLSAIRYYRLQQRDYDGTKSFSNVIAVNHLAKNLSFSLSPNPATDLVQINFPKHISYGEADLFIISADGRIVYHKNIMPSGGRKPGIDINLKDIPSGYYKILISGNSGTFQKALIIEH